MSTGLFIPFVVVIITVTVYFSLLIMLKPSKDTKLLAYLSQPHTPQEDKRKSRKKKKSLKDLKVLKSSEPDLMKHEEKSDLRASEKKECSHYVGYLTSLPKGAPFPEECFGCRSVIQCLRVEPTRVIESFYMGAAAEEEQ